MVVSSGKKFLSFAVGPFILKLMLCVMVYITALCLKMLKNSKSSK